MPTTPTPSVEQTRESGRIEADADIAMALTTTTVTYAVEEYLPFNEKWVTAYGGFDTVERAQYEYDRFTEKFGAAEKFRLTETTTVTTVKVISA